MRKEILDGEVRLSGCLGERYIGCGMKEGILHVEGTPGNALACYLDGGTILVDGNAQDAVADTMNAGLLAVRGSAGDALAYGMRGGCVYILGDAGYRAGVHMKAYEENRSTLVVGGRTGSFLGEYLAGGLIVVLGLGYEGEDVTGFFCGNGMYAVSAHCEGSCEPFRQARPPPCGREGEGGCPASCRRTLRCNILTRRRRMPVWRLHRNRGRQVEDVQPALCGSVGTCHGLWIPERGDG